MDHVADGKQRVSKKKEFMFDFVRQTFVQLLATS